LASGGMARWINRRKRYEPRQDFSILSDFLMACTSIGSAAETDLKRPARTIDPAMTPARAIPSPEKMPVVQNQWPGWIGSAKKSIRAGIPQWVNMVKLKDGVVNGATVTDGSLTGPSLLPMLTPSLMADGVPNSVINGLMGPVAEAVTFWASSVRVPNLPWYPTFVAVPAPVAPPTKSPATPLATLIQMKTFVEPAMLTLTVRARLAKEAETPEAQAAIKEFCNWFYVGFSAWLATATIKEVMGTGPVPTFNPAANIFSGPVIKGSANGGVISPAPVWTAP